MKTKYLIPVIFAFVLGFGWSLAWADDDDDEDDVVSAYALISGGKGFGFCTIKQDEKKVWAKVTVLNFTPRSSGTAWYRLDGPPSVRLGGNFADGSGQFVVEGHFKVDKGVAEIKFDVRDHERDISEIADDDDLTTELSNSKSNNDDEISIKMGTCTFANSHKD